MSKPNTPFVHQYFLLELTKRCHNDCIFCYNVWKEDDDYPSDEIPTEDYIKILSNVIDDTDCKYMALTGGEPLLKEGALEIASFISSRGVLPVLITNGKLLTREMVKKCMSSGIKYYEISLHSDKADIHESLVRRRGSFEEVIDAILNVRESGGHVNTVFVATKQNINTFKGFVELNALMGVEWILFNRVACGGSCMAYWYDLAPTPDEIQSVLEETAPIAEKYKIGISAGVQIQPCLVDYSKLEKISHGFCPLNNPMSDSTYFTIDPAGNLRMCNRSRVILGNLTKTRFGSIDIASYVKCLAEAIPEVCRECNLARVCGGGCKADALSFYGNLDRADPYLETWKARMKLPY